MIRMEGAIACKAVLEEEKREVYRLILDEKKKDRNLSYIRRLAEKRGVEVALMKRAEMDPMAQGKTYGGILLECGERNEEELILETDRKKPYFFAYLEGIEDPFNLGYIFRTLYAAGCDAVIMPKREWAENENVIEKSSAGAYEKLPLITLKESILENLKDYGIRIITAGRKDAQDMYDCDFTGHVCIAVGGPMRGLSALIEKYSSQTVYIPYERDFKNALNASSAVAVMAYEVYRQRRGKVF
ncbi:MAG: RNA methyltransferase [Erysipelotrichales bacterium]|nr:RNA methyltransferase [Erysipelotrichales bacterium]